MPGVEYLASHLKINIEHILDIKTDGAIAGCKIPIECLTIIFETISLE